MSSLRERLFPTTQIQENQFVGQETGNRKQNILSLTLTITLTILFLYLAFRGADIGEILNAARDLEVIYLIIATLFASFAFILRAFRWRVLLSAERKIAPTLVFWANQVGYLGNALLPARAGELLRTYYLGTKAGISKIFVLSTALTERILDVVALVLIAVFCAPFIKNLPPLVYNAFRIMGIAGMIALGGLILLPRLNALHQRIVHLLPNGLQERVNDILKRALIGMQSFQSPDRALAFTGLTAMIWLTDALGSMIGVQAFHMHLSLPQSLFFLVTLGLSSAIPSTPGYIGVYQFIAVTVLPQFGFTNNQALAYIIIAQLTSYLVVLFWGFIGLWRVNLYKVEAENPTVIPISPVPPV